MKRLLSYIIVSLLISSNSYAIEYVLNWQPYTYTTKAQLLKDMHNNRCSEEEKQIAAFEAINHKKISTLKENSQVRIQHCYIKSNLSDSDLSINDWETFEVPTAFMLSIELEKRSCRQIYLHQIPKFYEKNKEIPYNVDIFKPGQKIKIQRCIRPLQDKENSSKISSSNKKENKSNDSLHNSQLFFGASDEKNNTTWNFGIRTSHLNTFTLIGDLSGASNMIRLSYNYFLDDSKNFALFIEPGLHFSNNRTGIANAMAAIGVNYANQTWQLRLSKSATTINGVNFYVEKLLNPYWGVHFETINYYNRFQDKDIQFNKIGIGFYF